MLEKEIPFLSNVPKIFCFPSKVLRIRSRKGKTIFLVNTRKTIFQCNFFWEDHLFRTFGKRKNGFSCSEQFFTLLFGFNYISYLIVEILMCNSLRASYNNLFLSSIIEFALMELFFNKSLQPQTCNFIKRETLVQVFSREFCEISKNTFFYRTPPVAASASHQSVH